MNTSSNGSSNKVYSSYFCVLIYHSTKSTLMQYNKCSCVYVCLCYISEGYIKNHNIWLQANKLTINVSKSHYMIFRRRRKKNNINNHFLNNTVLQKINYTKFLGVIIDDGLKWTNHIAYVKNKIAKGFGIILRARKFFNCKTLLDLDHAFIFPCLKFTVLKSGVMQGTYMCSQ